MTKPMQKMTDGVMGFALDSDFLTHQGQCSACGQYQPERPATLALTCLEGSILLKRELAAQVTRERPPGPPKDPHKVSKAEAKKLMRYVP